MFCVCKAGVGCEKCKVLKGIMDWIRWAIGWDGTSDVARLDHFPRPGDLVLSKVSSALEASKMDAAYESKERIVARISMPAAAALDHIERANAIMSSGAIERAVSRDRRVEFEPFPFRTIAMIPPDFIEFGNKSWSGSLAELRSLIWRSFSGTMQLAYMEAAVRGELISSSSYPAGRCVDADKDGGMRAVIKPHDADDPESGGGGRRADLRHQVSSPAPGVQAMVERGTIRGTSRRFEFGFAFTQNKDRGGGAAEDFDVRSYVSLSVGPEALGSTGIRCIVKRFDIANPDDAADPAYVECVALGLMNELFRFKITPCAFPTFAIARTSCGHAGQQFVVMEDLGTMSISEAKKSIEGNFKTAGLVSRVYHSILTQFCIALSNLQAVLGMTHLDIHDKNVMVTRVPVHSTLTFKMDSVLYEVPTWGYVLRIIDFGMADLRPKSGFVVSSSHNQRSFRMGTATSRTTVDLPYFCVALLRNCMEKIIHNTDRCFVWEHVAKLVMRSFVVVGDGARVLSGWEEATRDLFRGGVYDASKRNGESVIMLTKEELAAFQDWIFSVQKRGGNVVLPFATPQAWLQDPSLSILEPYRVDKHRGERERERDVVVYPIFTTDAWDQDPDVQRSLERAIKYVPGFKHQMDRIADSYARIG